MITIDQLAILRDMFENCDDEWLLESLSLTNAGHRNYSISVNHGNWQDVDELFPGEYSSAPAEPARDQGGTLTAPSGASGRPLSGGEYEVLQFLADQHPASAPSVMCACCGRPLGARHIAGCRYAHGGIVSPEFGPGSLAAGRRG